MKSKKSKRRSQEKEQGEKKGLGEKNRPEKKSERRGESLFYDLQQAD